MKSKWRLAQLVFTCCLFIPVLHASDDNKTYSVGIVPQFEARKIHQIWQPILNQLEQLSGVKLKIRGAPSIPLFEQGLAKRDYDFAYMNPYHMVVANAAGGYRPLVRDHGRQLHGVLVVRKDSNINSPSLLAGKKVAFPAPNALGASLKMRQELHDQFAVRTSAQYVKTHDSVYLNVLLGNVAAGGGVQKTLNQQPADYQQKLRILHRTDKFNPHPFAASTTVADTVQEKIQQAFLKLGQTSTGQQLLSSIPVRKVGIATMADYASLSSMGLERFYIGQGN